MKIFRINFWGYLIWGALVISDSASAISCYIMDHYDGCAQVVQGLPPGATYSMTQVDSYCSDPHPVTGSSCFTVHLITLDLFCPPAHTLTSGGMCQSSCSSGSQWNAAAGGCSAGAAASACNTQSGNPIDFIQGEKYRTEPVITLGAVFPITLNYYYNNYKNGYPIVADNGATIVVPNAAMGGLSVASSVYPMNSVQYAEQYPRLASGETYSAYQGNATRYWRHTYEESLLPSPPSGLAFRWLSSDGKNIDFDDEGGSPVYPGIRLSPVTGNAAQQGWHKVILATQQREKLFDDAGKLRRITDTATGIHHDVIYTADNQAVQRIEHSLGGHIEFSFTELTRTMGDTDEDPETLTVTDRYIDRVSTHNNKHVTIEWNRTIIANTNAHVGDQWNPILSNETQNYKLITKISAPFSSAEDRYRTFAYNDARFPTSLTEIHLGRAGESETLYAEFRYDDHGRAIYSGLAGGRDAIAVAYPDDNNRAITSALGKQSTYTFANVNGVKRLQKVTGEPTANCVQTETDYQYDGSGNITEINEDGRITRFTYCSVPFSCRSFCQIIHRGAHDRNLAEKGRIVLPEFGYRHLEKPVFFIRQ